MNYLKIILLTFIGLEVFASLPPTTLKGSNESGYKTTFNINTGALPVNRTGTSVTFGTLPVSGGGTGLTSLTTYSLLSGSGTAINEIAPAASGTILFSNGASAFPSYRLLASSDISSALGYTPVASVTGSESILITGTASNPVVSVTTTGVVSGASFSKVFVDGYGRVTSSGSLLDSDIPSLDFSKITTGIVPVTQGGTGVSSTSTNSLLVGSGTTSFNSLSATTSGAVLKLDKSGNVNWLYPDTNSIVNFLSDPSFEQGSDEWVASGTATLSLPDRNANGVSYLKGDRFYLKVSNISNGDGACNTSTIPQNARGSDLEISAKYRNGFTVSGTILMTVSTGSFSTSQTIQTQAASSPNFSDSFLETPKIYVGTTSSTATVQTCFLLGSGSSIFDVDNVWVGTARSLKTGAIVEQRIAYTPTLTGFGTATNVEFYYTRVGDRVKVEGTLTAGTYSGAETRISLPNGWVTKTQTAATLVVGKWARGGVSINHGGFVLSESEKGYVTFSDSGTFSNSGINALAKTTSLSAAGDRLAFSFEVPVSVLSGSGTTFDSACPNDLSCSNEFTAEVDNLGNVQRENLDFINGSASISDTSLFTINFNAGVFTQTPNCIAAVRNSETSSMIAAKVTTASTSSVTVRTGFSSTATSFTKNAYDFVLFCQKSSSNFSAKKTIEGYLSKTVTSTGNFTERMERVSFGGASDTTSCASSPCTIHRQSGAISSVTRLTNGQYVVNFKAGTWSDKPVCTGMASNGANAMFLYLNSRSTTTYQFQTVTDAGGSTDSYVDVQCVGPR
jgi:hypothetical protein